MEKLLTWTQILEKNEIVSENSCLFPIGVRFPGLDYEFDFDNCDDILYGYANTSGKIVIAPQFTEAYEFTHCVAVVQVKNGKYGYIYPNGTWAIEPCFENAGNFMKNGFAIVVQNERFKIVKATLNESKNFFLDFEFLPKEFDSLTWNESEDLSLCIVRQGDIEFFYDVENDKKLSENYWVINNINDDFKLFVCHNIETGMWIVLDSELNPVCNEEFDKWYLDSFNSLKVEKNNKCAYIYWKEKRMSLWFDEEMECFHRTYESVVTIEDKKGLYDTVKGKWIVEPKADSIKKADISNLCHIVQDDTGAYLILYNNKKSAYYDDIIPVYGQFYRVRRETKYNYVKVERTSYSELSDTWFDFASDRMLKAAIKDETGKLQYFGINENGEIEK